MDGFDLNGLMGMMGGLHKQMTEMQRAAAETIVEGSAGGGLVKIQVTGDQNVVSVKIAPEAMEDRELLEDLLRAAMDDALTRSKEAMSGSLKQMAGGLPIPPGFLPGF